MDPAYSHAAAGATAGDESGTKSVKKRATAAAAAAAAVAVGAGTGTGSVAGGSGPGRPTQRRTLGTWPLAGREFVDAVPLANDGDIGRRVLRTEAIGWAAIGVTIKYAKIVEMSHSGEGRRPGDDEITASIEDIFRSAQIDHWEVKYGDGTVEQLVVDKYIAKLKAYLEVKAMAKPPPSLRLSKEMLTDTSVPPQFQVVGSDQMSATEVLLVKKRGRPRKSTSGEAAAGPGTENAAKSAPVVINLDDTLCTVCQSGEDEDRMLLCDMCNRGYHMACLQPPLSEPPSGSWFCPVCVESSKTLRTLVFTCERCGKTFKSHGGYKYHVAKVCIDSRTEENTKLKNEIREDLEAAVAKFCSVCGAKGADNLVKCSDCSSWMHVECQPSMEVDVQNQDLQQAQPQPQQGEEGGSDEGKKEGENLTDAIDIDSADDSSGDLDGARKQKLPRCLNCCLNPRTDRSAAATGFQAPTPGHSQTPKTRVEKISKRTCDNCGKNFKTVMGFKYHIANVCNGVKIPGTPGGADAGAGDGAGTEGGNGNESANQPPGPPVCSLCSKEFPEGELEVAPTCLKCSKHAHLSCLASSASIGDDGRWVCESCQDQVYACEICNKRFKSLPGWRYHVKNVCNPEFLNEGSSQIREQVDQDLDLSTRGRRRKSRLTLSTHPLDKLLGLDENDDDHDDNNNGDGGEVNGGNRPEKRQKRGESSKRSSANRSASRKSTGRENSNGDNDDDDDDEEFKAGEGHSDEEDDDDDDDDDENSDNKGGSDDDDDLDLDGEFGRRGSRGPGTPQSKGSGARAKPRAVKPAKRSLSIVASSQDALFPVSASKGRRVAIAKPSTYASDLQKLTKFMTLETARAHINIKLKWGRSSLSQFASFAQAPVPVERHIAFGELLGQYLESKIVSLVDWIENFNSSCAGSNLTPIELPDVLFRLSTNSGKESLELRNFDTVQMPTKNTVDSILSTCGPVWALAFSPESYEVAEEDGSGSGSGSGSRTSIEKFFVCGLSRIGWVKEGLGPIQLLDSNSTRVDVGVDSHHVVGRRSQCPTLLEVWKVAVPCGIAKSSPDASSPAPFLQYCIAFRNRGPIWNTSWNPTRFSDPALNSILGILAIVFGDGSCLVIPVLKRVISDQHNINCIPVISEEDLFRWELGLPTALIMCCDWNPTVPSELTTGHSDGSIATWNLDLGQLYALSLETMGSVVRLEKASHSCDKSINPNYAAHAAIRTIAYCPLQPFLIATGGYDSVLKVWHSSNCFGPVYVKKVEGGWVYDTAWDPFGKGIYSSTSDLTELSYNPLWNGSHRHGLYRHYCHFGGLWRIKAFADDDQTALLSVASDGSVRGGYSSYFLERKFLEPVELFRITKLDAGPTSSSASNFLVSLQSNTKKAVSKRPKLQDLILSEEEKEQIDQPSNQASEPQLSLTEEMDLEMHSPEPTTDSPTGPQICEVHVSLETRATSKCSDINSIPTTSAIALQALDVCHIPIPSISGDSTTMVVYGGAAGLVRIHTINLLELTFRK